MLQTIVIFSLLDPPLPPVGVGVGEPDVIEDDMPWGVYEDIIVDNVAAAEVAVEEITTYDVAIDVVFKSLLDAVLVAELAADPTVGEPPEQG